MSQTLVLFCQQSGVERLLLFDVHIATTGAVALPSQNSHAPLHALFLFSALSPLRLPV